MDEEKKIRVRVATTVNKSVIKKYVESLNPDLRVSREFVSELDAIIRQRVAKAVSRQRSFKGVTLKKDALYM